MKTFVQKAKGMGMEQIIGFLKQRRPGAVLLLLAGVMGLVIGIQVKYSFMESFMETEGVKETEQNRTQDGAVAETMGKGETIKWVDFNIPYEVLCKAYDADIATYEEDCHIDWIELLAYLAAKNGGDFKGGVSSEMDKITERVKNGETTLEKEGEALKYYDYYYRAYKAVLGSYVGEYKICTETEEGKRVWEKRYGLKVFSPIAKGFEYSDYDDFGTSRSYGYSRPHLGHDMMGR